MAEPNELSLQGGLAPSNPLEQAAIVLLCMGEDP